MKENTPALVSVIQRVQENVRDAESSIKKNAMLRNLTAYDPILTNDTRHAGNHDFSFQHTHAEDDLVTDHENKNSDFRIGTSLQFSNSVSKFQRMLKVMVRATT